VPTAVSALAHLSAGLVLFLVGLVTLRAGLQGATTTHMKLWIRRLVRTPWRGCLTGIAATMAMQSSAAVTIISMGLVGAGVLSFPDTIGVILGTNIGSTFTVGLLALDIERIGPWLALSGFTAFTALWLLLRKRRSRLWRLARAACISLVGFGALFTGFGLMNAAAQPLLTSAALRTLILATVAHPVVGVVAGTVLTALIGSSSATTALVISLAGQGGIPIAAAIAFVFGNNIGTCLTAILASLGGTRPVQRVAATHVFLNIAATLCFLPLLTPFTWTVTSLASTPAEQIVLAHVLFNVISSLAALPFAKAIAVGLTRLLP